MFLKVEALGCNGPTTAEACLTMFRDRRGTERTPSGHRRGARLPPLLRSLQRRSDMSVARIIQRLRFGLQGHGSSLKSAPGGFQVPDRRESCTPSTVGRAGGADVAKMLPRVTEPANQRDGAAVLDRTRDSTQKPRSARVTPTARSGSATGASRSSPTRKELQYPRANGDHGDRVQRHLTGRERLAPVSKSGAQQPSA